jgi:hypothetical protein
VGEIIKTIFNALGDRNSLVKISVFLFVFVFIYFFYIGVTTTPEIINESDSLTYHIPIAQSLASGNLFNPPDLIRGIGYYPASGEAILSLFYLTGIPPNLFNLLGLTLLFFFSIKLGKTFKASDSSAIIFATSVVFFNSVLRLVTAQTIDIWLAVFFVLSLILLKSKDKGVGYYIKLGLALGFLIGVKYSGLFYASGLVLLFGKDLFGKNYLKNFFLFVVPVIFTGGIWYIRNYILTGNPIYPGSLFNFTGHPEFVLQNWNPLRTLIKIPGGIWRFIQALISEYLIWPFSYLVLTALIIKRKLSNSGGKLAALGLINFGIYLFLPSWPENLVSDLRYLFPSFIPMLLGLFLLAERYKKSNELYIVAILSSVSVLAQFAYRPKIIIVWLLTIVVIVNFFKKR